MFISAANIDIFLQNESLCFDFFKICLANAVAENVAASVSVLRLSASAPTSPGLVFSTPGLVFSTQGLVRNSRRLVKHISRRVRLGRRNGIITLKNALICLVKALFTRVYIRILFPEKSIHHSHNARCLLIFNSFECEGFDFKVFTGAA